MTIVNGKAAVWSGENTLHISNRVNGIKYKLLTVRFVDKDTNQFVYFIPALNISGYGETIEKAQEMLNFSLEDFFGFLVSLSADIIPTELAKYGWKRDAFFKKDYSVAYVDSNGELQNLNAVDNKIEILTLESA
jgi:hypothetical protein